ncbi:MAG: hypothetical protein A2Z47_04180 [Thermodesulfovibrio sp. RBG_19FT_COMBO_42_12]|nr:MAG: hypothetical protein A2Z47_04180 [Thermodesulfovibrio sp. RBG_19FT_COMBO_42_12]
MRRITLSLILVILCISLIGWFVKHSAKLDEKRALAIMPAISLRQMLDNTFYLRIERYFNDHFIFRSQLINAKSWIDYNLFRSPISSKVHIGKDNWLYLDEELFDYTNGGCKDKEKIRELAFQLNELERMLELSGKKFIFIVAPNKSTIYPEYVDIDQIRLGCQKSRYDILLESFKEYPVRNIIRLDNVLNAAKRREQVYFKTDTHWNVYGAKLASHAILSHLYHIYQLSLSRQQFPDIKISPYTYSGDLAQMLSLDISENSGYPEKISYHSEFYITNLKPLSNGYPCFRATAKPSDNELLLPMAILYRDSFMNVPVRFLTSSFEQLDVYWTYNIPTEEGKEDLYSSNIVLIEIVERNLINLNINLQRFKEMLSRDFMKVSSYKIPEETM